MRITKPCGPGHGGWRERQRRGSRAWAEGPGWRRSRAAWCLWSGEPEREFKSGGSGWSLRCFVKERVGRETHKGSEQCWGVCSPVEGRGPWTQAGARGPQKRGWSGEVSATAGARRRRDPVSDAFGGVRGVLCRRRTLGGPSRVLISSAGAWRVWGPGRHPPGG